MNGVGGSNRAQPSRRWGFGREGERKRVHLDSVFICPRYRWESQGGRKERTLSMVTVVKVRGRLVI